MKTRLALTLLFTSLACSLAFAEPRGSLTIDRIAAIKHPSDAAWSPDGSRVAFLWDDAGRQNVWVVTPGQSPEPLTHFEASAHDLTSDIEGLAWLTPERLLFAHDGSLWTVESGTAPRRLAGLEATSGFDVSSDGRSVAYTSNGRVGIAPLGDGAGELLTEGLGAVDPVLSPDGRHIAFTAVQMERVADVLPYNGAKQALYYNDIDGFRLGIVSVEGGPPKWLELDGRPSYVQWVDAGNLLYQRTSDDMKTREIYVAGLDGSSRRIRHDYDARWWSPLRRDAQTVVSPDGKHVAFFSDETGWTQLYVMPLTGAEPEARQLTSGELEVGFGSWSADGTKIAFYDNQASPMERFVRIVDIETGTISDVVTTRGVNYLPRLSADGNRVVFERTDATSSVDLYVAEVGQTNQVTRLTRSMPAAIDAADLTAPEPVTFPSRVDGKPVPGTLFVPEHLDRSRKHPAIVWIHGSGSEQNFLGWHPFSYRMYYSANQYLAQQGYIILAVDYRGSSGYGREWGTGHHLDLGGSDALDVASGADYLETLPYVDPDRIGVWGLSYGGFLTLQVLTMTPQRFACGIDAAGVTDWATWGMESNGGWIRGRMDTPEDNPEGYFRSASIKHMDKLEKPLLILHGTADVNVAFRESLNLVDVLLKLGKPFDFEVYPGEFHYFRRSHILKDAWGRAEAFFDEHLKAPRSSSTQ